MKIIQTLAICVALACVGPASADTLYWQVDTSAGDAAYTGDWEYANLYATTTPGKGDPASAVLVDGAYDIANGTTKFQSDLGEYGTNDYSFFVELINNSGQTVWTQYTTTYDNLVSAGYVSTSGMSVPSPTVTGNMMNGAAVPEPTSGVMLLLGGALLALRRRRRA